MRHGAIHGETNSCPKAIHARQGNSLAIGRDASPTLGCEPGGMVLNLGRLPAARQRRIITAGNGRLVAAPTITRPYRYPERDVEGAVPYGGSGQFSSVFNHPEGIHSCAMAQFMVKPIHAPRQFMPARAIHWPSAAMPPPAGCHVRKRKCLTTPPAFCPDKKPPPLTRGGMRWCEPGEQG